MEKYAKLVGVGLIFKRETALCNEGWDASRGMEGNFRNPESIGEGMRILVGVSWEGVGE